MSVASPPPSKLQQSLHVVWYLICYALNNRAMHALRSDQHSDSQSSESVWDQFSEAVKHRTSFDLDVVAIDGSKDEYLHFQLKWAHSLLSIYTGSALTHSASLGR